MERLPSGDHQSPVPGDRSKTDDRASIAWPLAATLGVGQKVGNCLVDLENGQIVAADSQIADWLGAEPDQCGAYAFSDLAPALAPGLCADVKQDGLAIQATLSRHGRVDVPAEFTITFLTGRQAGFWLVSARLHHAIAETPRYRDPLTGLPDRRELANQRARWRQHWPDRPLPHAVLFLDLDEFKQVNDRHGHAVGDQVLAVLGPRWQGCIREVDLLARYGGDEFAVLLAGISRLEEVEPIVARLVTATALPIAIGDLQVKVTATIGVALAKDTSTDLQQLLDEADRNMYAAKVKRTRTDGRPS